MNRRNFNSMLIGCIGAGLLQSTFAQSHQVPPEFVALGVQEDGRWLSPQFGVQVEWEQPFEMDYTPGSSIFTNEYGDQFNIALPNTHALFNVSLSGPTSTLYLPFDQIGESIQDFEKDHDPQFLLYSEADDIVGALLVLEWGQSALDGNDIPNQIYLLQSYPSRDNPDVMINTRIDAGYDDIEEYVSALDQHVTVNNGPALRAFGVDEIMEALKDLPKE